MTSFARYPFVELRYKPLTLTLNPVWFPDSNLILLHLIPALFLLKTQKDFVEEGIVENTVSRDMISPENVSLSAVDVENLSSSLHDKNNKPKVNKINVMILFISDITQTKEFYFAYTIDEQINYQELMTIIWCH